MYYNLLPIILSSGFYEYLVTSLTTHLLPEWLLAWMLKVAHKVRSPNSANSLTLGTVTSSVTLRDIVHNFKSLVESGEILNLILGISYFSSVPIYWDRGIKESLLKELSGIISSNILDDQTLSYKWISDFLANLPSLYSRNSCNFLMHRFVYTNSGYTQLGIFRFRSVDFNVPGILYALPQASVKQFDNHLFDMFCLFLYHFNPVFTTADGTALPNILLAGEGVVDMTNVNATSSFEFLFSLKLVVERIPAGNAPLPEPLPENGGNGALNALVPQAPNRNRLKPKHKNNPVNRRYSTEPRPRDEYRYVVSVDFSSFIYKRLDIGFSYSPLSTEFIFH
jgi:hypothetical protein